MSRDIVILTPNGRRVKVHCTADTNILQVNKITDFDTSMES